jgi:hypothetical protein
VVLLFIMNWFFVYYESTRREPKIVVYFESIKREVARGTGTPNDKDEVNRREVCECDG